MEAENSIKKFLQAKIEKTQIKEVKDKIKGYWGATTLNFLAYLKEILGELHAINIMNIQCKMKEFFNIKKGMAVYTKDMEDDREISKTAGIPIPNTTMVEISTASMYQAEILQGVF